MDRREQSAWQTVCGQIEFVLAVRASRSRLSKSVSKSRSKFRPRSAEISTLSARRESAVARLSPYPVSGDRYYQGCRARGKSSLARLPSRFNRADSTLVCSARRGLTRNYRQHDARAVAAVVKDALMRGAFTGASHAREGCSRRVRSSSTRRVRCQWRPRRSCCAC